MGTVSPDPCFNYSNEFLLSQIPESALIVMAVLETTQQNF